MCIMCNKCKKRQKFQIFVRLRVGGILRRFMFLCYGAEEFLQAKLACGSGSAIVFGASLFWRRF